MTRFLEESTPDVVIFYFAPYWRGEVAARLGVCKVCFCVLHALFLGSVAPWTDAMTMMSIQEITTELDDFVVGVGRASTDGDGRIKTIEFEKFLRPPEWVPL